VFQKTGRRLSVHIYRRIAFRVLVFESTLTSKDDLINAEILVYPVCDCWVSRSYFKTILKICKLRS